MSSGRVLIGGDNHAVAEKMLQLLKELGYYCERILQTGNFIEQIDKYLPDIIMLVFFAKIDLDFLMALKESTNNSVPIVVYSEDKNQLNANTEAKIIDPLNCLTNSSSNTEIQLVLERLLYKFKATRYQNTMNAVPDLILHLSSDGTILNVTGGKAFDKQVLLAMTERASKIQHIFPEDMADKIEILLNKAVLDNEIQIFEYSPKEIKNVLMNLEVRIAAHQNELIAVFRDITDRKETEERMAFLGLHDQLTGLYNRNYFEEELRRLESSRDYPISIIYADLDSLKLFNDAIGHREGDKLLKSSAQLLKSPLRKADLLARVGGDEFVVVLPKTDEVAGRKVIERIKSGISNYNEKFPELPVSISFGIATNSNGKESLTETLKKADNLMYRGKLTNSANVNRQILSFILSALDKRDYLYQGHGERVKHLCHQVGIRIELTSAQLERLTLLAQYHDLGKIGMPEHILFKNSVLNEDEWEIIKQHAEIGYRIANAYPEFKDIADLILAHHENWDGSGYPLGIKEKNIPIECRIMRIADAFDVMTSQRPYRHAKTKEQAVKKLRKLAGIQFDPVLIKEFLLIL